MRNCTSKTGWISAPTKKKKNDFGALFKRNFNKRKINNAKLEKICCHSQSQPWCSHYNTIYNAQLQRTIVLRMQPRYQATLTQPLHCVLQHHVANPNLSTHMATEHGNNQAASTPMQTSQCILQHHVAYPHVSTRMETDHDKNHAAITLRSATKESTSTKNYAHMNNHTLQNTKGEPIRR